MAFIQIKLIEPWKSGRVPVGTVTTMIEEKAFELINKGAAELNYDVQKSVISSPAKIEEEE